MPMLDRVEDPCLADVGRTDGSGYPLREIGDRKE